MIPTKSSTFLQSLSLQSLKKVHIIGIGGTLMGAFATFLKRAGIEVTGSDLDIYPPMSDVLRNAGIQIFSGYQRENIEALSTAPELVIIGNVIRRDNPEAQAVFEKGYPYTSLPEAMEHILLKQTRNVVIAGTHGKTTTSSLMAHVFKSCEKDPNYFIGGVSEDLPFSFHVTDTRQGRLFVLEGDEYDTAFWDKVPKFNHYLPDDVILTSIEYDHADIYPDLNAVVDAFRGLLSRIRPGGRLIACHEYSWVKDLIRASSIDALSYGVSPKCGARFTLGEWSFHPSTQKGLKDMTRFEIKDGNQCVDEIALQISGQYNLLNALAVWIECRELGLNPVTVRKAFETFRGVKRRQEVRGDIGGVLVIDDFAHHPTAVRETLQGLRFRYPNRRIVAVFEPRSATSRRKIFQADYALAFQQADLIFISAPFDQSRIPSQDQFSSEVLVDDLKKKNKICRLMSTVEEGVIQVSESVRSGDLVVILSNGGFGGFISKLLERLKRKIR